LGGGGKVSGGPDLQSRPVRVSLACWKLSFFFRQLGFLGRPTTFGGGRPAPAQVSKHERRSSDSASWKAAQAYEDHQEQSSPDLSVCPADTGADRRHRLGRADLAEELRDAGVRRG